jgi:hypothetical protein
MVPGSTATGASVAEEGAAASVAGATASVAVAALPHPLSTIAKSRTRLSNRVKFLIFMMFYFLLGNFE